MHSKEKFTGERNELVSKPAKKKVPKKVLAHKAAMPRLDRAYTFEQWARRRGIKQHHKGGLHAFVVDVDRSRSLDVWDDCFKDY